MTLKEIASVSGKSGLYKVLKPTRTGIILETIDNEKKRIIANANSRVSLLKEISVYTTSEEGSMLLEVVFKTIKEKKGESVELPKTDADLYKFLGEIVPTFDKEKVYASDIKKMITWFNIVNKFYPEAFAETEAEKTEDKKEKVAKTTKETKAKAVPKAAAPKVAAAKKGGGATAVKSAKRGA
jgi:transcriptional regulator